MSLTERIGQHVAAKTKTRKSAATRERIVGAAEALVRERGSADFQMAEVASSLGMTKGSLYYYFPDRTALVEEVFDRAAQEFVTGLEEAVAAGMPPHETLATLCSAFAAEVSSGGALVVALASELAGTAGALSRLETRIERVSAIVEGQLERAREAGEVRDGVDLGLAATAICGSFLLAAFRRVREQGDDFDDEAFSAELMDLVTRGLVRRRA